MQSDRWSRVRALFDAAMALPPEARQGHVRDSAEADDIRGEVLSLLAHATEGSGAAAGFLAPPADARPRRAEAGQRLGAWILVEPLGVGGMGEVWRAARADGAYQGQAAIKLLKPGMDSAAVLERFALERQALARLDHPHIARLHDAGLSPQGHPFVVMELVPGQPLDRACAGLPLEERLSLFLQLAEAVAHAHRHLLVHRDLKPGNVLVTPEGQVKLLDFGIAKAIDPLEGDQPDLSALGERPFTPGYASPEQLRGEPVGTSTDLYSLGVLLYQLLTGQRPYGRSADSAQALAQAALHEQPTRPSSLPVGEGSDPGWPARRLRLRGDLDNILLKALEKEPERRYATVDQLIADLRAFLDHRPVSARAARPTYLLAKFVRRHRLPVALGSAALLALVLGGTAAAWQAHQAGLARDEARAQLSALKRITQALVFRFSDAAITLPGGAQAQEALLNQTLAQLDELLQRMPDDEDLQALVAASLGRLAELQGNQTLAAPLRASEAQATVTRALALGEPLWRQRLGDWQFALWHVRSLAIRAQLERLAQQPARGVASLDESIRRADEALGVASGAQARAHLLAARANALLLSAQLHDQAPVPSLQQPRQALALYARAEQDWRDLLADKALIAEVERQAVPGDPPTEAYLLHQIGTALGGRALVHLRLDELPLMRERAAAALRLRRANVEREPRNVAWRDGLMVEANTLAIAQIRLADPAALASAKLAWDTAAALAREQGPQSKWAGAAPLLAPQLGRALALNGRHAEALQALEPGLVFWQATLQAQPQHPSAARRLALLELYQARSLRALGRSAPATQALLRAIGHLDGLADSRDRQLAQAEVLAELSEQQPDRAAERRVQALAALDRAAAGQALAADHEALRRRLGARRG